MGWVALEQWGDDVARIEPLAAVDDALRVTTINGAYSSHEEAIKGSIAEGKLADFVMLAEDPHTVNPNRIKDIEIVRTVVGGETMYQK